MNIRTQRESGFTLIELMIVIAIIGILAAVGIPAYQDYIGRAQASEAIHLSAAAKSPLVEYYTSKGEFPTALTDVYNTTSGKYTASITGAASGTTGYIVTAVMAASGVNSSIASKRIRIQTDDGGVTWACGAGATNPMPTNFLPSTCRD